MADPAEKKVIRILHVVGGMDTGGIETWLMHVLRRLDRNRYQFDFLTHTDKPCFYDDEIRSLGGRIISCPHTSSPWTYARKFLGILKEHGSYDVVHSHVHHFSGFPMMLAKLAGVPARIAHSHNDTSLMERRAGVRRKFYLQAALQLIQRYSTAGLGCSAEAAANLFGTDWKRDPRWQVLYCGINLDPFKGSFDRPQIRRELGIPAEAFVIGHVGRFSAQKNHHFLLDVFSAISRRENNAYLLLVGNGELREELVEKTKGLGLMDKVIFAGVRPDVARVMSGAMDVFVFPSHHEGLSLVLVEAQAAGLPTVISDTLTDETIIMRPLIRKLSLKDDISVWAETALLCRSFRHQAGESLQCVSDSKFNIIHGVEELTRVYAQGVI